MRKKKILYILLCTLFVLSLSACDSPIVEQTQSESEMEEYRMTYEETLEMMHVIISESLMNDEKTLNTPKIANRVQLPDSDLYVGVDKLETVIYVYEVDNGETLGLTPQEIIDLYSTPNEENQVIFDELIDWYRDYGGSLQVLRYRGFFSACYGQYDSSSDMPFIDKEAGMYTATERHAVVKWGLENIDVSYIEETLNNTDPSTIDQFYIQYLYHLGLIDAYGQPVNNN
ncbi:MAG: hypothetical protein R3Y67_02520 [Eubacteriales bacterium]